MPKTYTVKEVADILGFSTNSIYTFLKEKRIKGVRVGKGRFRIPDEELSRVLHLSKKSIASPIAAPTQQRIVSASASPVSALLSEGDAVFLQPKNSDHREDHGELLVPNIFDWFVGLSAVVAGVALFIFNSSLTTVEIPHVALIYPTIRIVLIASGLGLLISSLFRDARGWSKVFHFILSVMGFFNAYGLILSRDIDGALLYGALALVIGVTSVVPFGGVVSVGMYVSFIALLIPFTVLFSPLDQHVASLSTMLGMSTVMIGISSLITAVAALIFFWVGYGGNRIAFLIAPWFLALCDVAVAIWYAHLQYWSRSFFVIIVAYFTALLPHWWPLQQKISRRYAFLLHGLFIGIGSVFIFAILIVFLLQQSIWVSREREIMNKMELGQARLQNSIVSVKSSLAVSAANLDFIEVIAKKDIASLNTYSKIIYESNSNIRRLVFLDKDGNGVSVYPYGTFDELNFAFRDYFQQTKNTGHTYVSDVFQARVDHAGRYVVVVAEPLYDKKKEFAGVLTASVDLDQLSLGLAQIASSSQGEYFVVIDSRGIILSHPNQMLIGTDAPNTDPIFRAFKGEKGVVQGIMIEKMQGMIAYADVPELRWAISLRVPSTRIFALSSSSIWIVFGVVCVVLVASIVIFSYIHNRIAHPEGGT